MPIKSRFAQFDAFAKTVEDASVRTRSGGIITIVALLVLIYLIWGEWCEYRRIVVLPELIVDKGRGERMEIHLNITFPVLPCELLTLDVMDVSGELQTSIEHGIHKVRLSPASEGGKVLDMTALQLHKEHEDSAAKDPNYCGECYGAEPPVHATKPGCCNTCEEVREAYTARGWAFGRGEGVEQCEREGFAAKLDEQRHEGCRLEGVLRVNKVVGNFHIAPGRSFTAGAMHGHVLDNYYETPVPHTMSHIIHQLRFGPQLPDELSERWKWTEHHYTNPLDDTSQPTDDPRFNFMYFIKVVSTSYLPLGWDVETSYKAHQESGHLAPLGEHGVHLGHESSIEAHQYSVTAHKRSIDGGDDAAEGHKERIHTQGGIPGVFFNYDISPIKIINREVRPKTFSMLLTGICSAIGGTLTVAAAIDRALYAGVKSWRGRKLHLS